MGCMEGITYNGENITNLVRKRKVDTSSFVRTLVFFHVLLAFGGDEAPKEVEGHGKRKHTTGRRFLSFPFQFYLESL